MSKDYAFTDSCFREGDNRMKQRIKELIATTYHRYIGYPLAVNSFNFKILSDEETINEIVGKKLSISRFGDGEYGMMMGGYWLSTT